MRQEHLAPLFFLLHRRVAVETIELATQTRSENTMLPLPFGETNDSGRAPFNQKNITRRILQPDFALILPFATVKSRDLVRNGG